MAILEFLNYKNCAYRCDRYIVIPMVFPQTIDENPLIIFPLNDSSSFQGEI
jgi:hypothetical protein